MQEDTDSSAKRALLVGVQDEKMSAEEAGTLSRELKSLVDTLGLEVAALEVVRVRESSAKYGMGTGKAEELAEKAASLGVQCIIFDRDISPSQQRNWEQLANIPIIDRQELIIQIFAHRARTKEAELQISLAELKYALPRLQHKYINLSRQRGGRYGTKGSGETRFETDRRLVQQRIHKLEQELEVVKRQRQVQRQHRQRQGISVCALVGYTNTGKSSILNALTGAEVLAEDKLFATLDPTSRRLELPCGTNVLLVDTVGFIRRLPHNLVNAFRSTLEEATRADILLHVIDAAEIDSAAQYRTTMSVLEELGAGKIPVITVLNKIDLLTSEEELAALKKQYPDSVAVSASSGKGLPELTALVESSLSRAVKRFRFPPERTDLAALLHRNGQVTSESFCEEYIEMEARVDERTAGLLKEYLFITKTETFVV